ncbi:MAG: hybrid sensor histidine kinase/response regulator [Anaeromyxobacteraceae bacterium]
MTVHSAGRVPRADAAARRVQRWVPIAYAAVASAWIAGSDLALRLVSHTPGEYVIGSVAKGLAFVAVTAMALHVVLRRALAGQRRAFESLERATAALRGSDERKERVIGILSHELRNPLASMRQATWLLEHGAPGDARHGKALETLGRQLLHLTRLTDDLFDLSLLTHGRARFERARVDLCKVLGAAIQDHERLFASRGIAVATVCPELPLWVEGDAIRLGQALANILWNAAKFTPSGGHIRAEVTRAPGMTAVIRVTDDGVGVPPELLRTIFEPFTQADRSLDRSHGGLGVGLAIVRSVAAAHGGSVVARSDGPGRGTQLELTLPLASEAAAVDGARSLQPAHRHHRVLVIEDNLDAATTLRDLLLMWNHEVELAHDGVEGIAKARAFLPTVVLCDLGLPGLDGYEVARAIRRLPELSGAFLVAVTGYASTEDARRAASAGFDRHVGKPVPVHVFEEVLATVPAAGPLH